MKVIAAVFMSYSILVIAIIAHDHTVRKEIAEVGAKLDRIERKLNETLKHDDIDPTQFNAPPASK